MNSAMGAGCRHPSTASPTTADAELCAKRIAARMEGTAAHLKVLARLRAAGDDGVNASGLIRVAKSIPHRCAELYALKGSTSDMLRHLTRIRFVHPLYFYDETRSDDPAGQLPGELDQTRLRIPSSRRCFVCSPPPVCSHACCARARAWRVAGCVAEVMDSAMDSSCLTAANDVRARCDAPHAQRLTVLPPGAPGSPRPLHSSPASLSRREIQPTSSY